MARRITLILLLGLAASFLVLTALEAWSERESVRTHFDEVGQQSALLGAQMTAYVIEKAIANGVLDATNLMEDRYEPIPDSDPPRYHTSYDHYCDHNLVSLQEALLETPAVYYAYVATRDGYIPVHTNAALAKQRLPELEPKADGTSLHLRRGPDGYDYYEYSSPIMIQRRPWGEFRVGIPSGLVASEIRDNIVAALALGVVGSLALATLIHATVRRGLRPLRELADVATRMAEGDWTARANYAGHDEFAEVTRSFNAMTAALQASHDTLEQRVHERTAELEMIFENNPSGMVLVDAETRTIARVNENALRMFGGTRKEVLGQPCQDVICASTSGHCPILDGGQPSQAAECILHTLAGDELPVFKCAVPVTVDGRPHLLETFADIGDLKQAENALQDHLHFLRTLLDTIPNAIFYKDVEGRYRECNTTFAEWMGRPREEVLGKTVRDLNPMDLADQYAEMDDGLFKQVGRRAYESQLANANGTRRDVIFHKATCTDATGRITGLVGVATDISERKRLDEARQRVQKAVDDANDAIVIVENDGTVTYLNMAFQQLFRRTLETVNADGWEAFFVDPAVARAVQQATLNLDNWIGEAHMQCAEGRRFPAEVRATPMLNDVLQPTGMLLFINDITDRKRAEQDLRQKESELMALLDNLPDLAWLKDTDSRFILVNRKFAAGYGGVDPAELKGKSDLDLWPRELAERYRADDQRIMQIGETERIDEPLVDQAGCEHWIETIKSPIRDADGHVVGTVGLARDITARKLAEEELARYAQQLEQANADLQIANDEAGAARERAEQARAELQAAQAKLIDASRQAGMAEVATGVLHNVGNVLNSVNVSAHLVVEKVQKSRAPNVVRAAGLLHEHSADLAAFLTADDRGRQLPDYLSQLGQYLTDEQRAILEELRALTSNVEHIRDIVATQQNYAGVSGLIEPLILADVVEDALQMSAGAFERHGIRLVREYADLPPITTDRQKVLQIIVNLVRNAKNALRDSAQSDRQLCVRIEATTARRVRLSVIDNGVGIPAENITRIFSHGFTTRKDGHGFGLHSSALAAKELGGALTVHSAGPGQGATFALEIPVQLAKVNS